MIEIGYNAISGLIKSLDQSLVVGQNQSWG